MIGIGRSRFGAFRFGSVRFGWTGHGGQGRVGHVRVCHSKVRLGKASARRSWQRATRHGLAGKAGRSRFVSSG